MDFIERPVLDNEGILLGLFVDALLTEEKPDYKVCDNIPTGKIKSLLDALFADENNRYKKLLDLEKEILKLCYNFGIYPSYKDVTRVAKVLEYSSYWEALNQCAGGLVIDSDVYERGLKIAESFNIFPYFNDKKQDCIFQRAYLFEVSGVKCKALPDIIHIDNEREVINVIDIKTTSEPLMSFHKTIEKYRYDIQAAFYVDAVRTQFKTFEICFSFLVQNTKDIFKPKQFHMSAPVIDTGKYGNPRKKGYLELIEDYKWYLENGFEEHRDLVNKNYIQQNDYGNLYLG